MSTSISVRRDGSIFTKDRSIDAEIRSIATAALFYLHAFATLPLHAAYQMYKDEWEATAGQPLSFEDWFLHGHGDHLPCARTLDRDDWNKMSGQQRTEALYQARPQEELVRDHEALQEVRLSL